MIGLDDIQDARSRIVGHTLSTPLVASPTFSESCALPLGLKLEHRQANGSFKLHGATNAILKLTEPEQARAVVAASIGNHARALSHAARATICMSRLVPEKKVSEIRRLGAEVRIIGSSQDEQAYAAREFPSLPARSASLSARQRGDLRNVR